MLCLYTECYARVHLQCVVATSKSVSIEDDHLETDVCSASSDMDAIDYHEVLQGLLARAVTIIMRYHVHSTTLFSQLQL